MDSKPLCKYGDKCYRKNPAHLNDFQHPDGKAEENDPQSESAASGTDPVSPPKSPKETTTTATACEIADAQQEQKEETSVAESKDAATEEPETQKTTESTSEAGGRRRSHSFEDLEGTPVKRHASESATTQQPKCFDQNTDISQLKEYKELVADHPEFIRQKFMVSMPDDFYKMWQFCESQNPMEPFDAFRVFGLILTGPYDVLAGKFDKLLPLEPAVYLKHCRYFYDPPEFQTVLVKIVANKRTGVHFGYWRDHPSDEKAPCFVASNDETVGCEVKIVADNIFLAVLNFLESDLPPSPFVRVAANTMKKKLKSFADEHGIPLNGFADKLKERNKNVVCRTFHKAGLVVPVQAKTQIGYRPLQENDASLKKLLAHLDDPEDGSSEAAVEMVMEKLQPLITAANIAVDESDFGNSIELGIDLFCCGSKRLHAIAMQLLATGYSMVQRPQLIAILKAHLSDRQRGIPKSVVEDTSPYLKK